VADTQRTGRVTLRVDVSPDRFQTFPVRQEADGTVYYHLGKAARTPDGWVTLPPSQLGNVVWDKE
jgi:hypothetical protein